MKGADALVIPGVGHFGQCIEALAERDWTPLPSDFAGSGRQVFGVCVGMQILFEGATRAITRPRAVARAVRALGNPDGRRTTDLTVPHIGWNTVEWAKPPEHPYLAGISTTRRTFYFVHSYAPFP